VRQARRKQASVPSVPIDEASAKIRTGGAKDDEADHALDIRARVLPLRMQTLAPIADPSAGVYSPLTHVNAGRAPRT
jgi:hypothetical protein